MTKEDRTERFQLAYDLAWFIHCRKQVAYLIAIEAVYRWEVLSVQGQRPLSSDQKFQRLVFEVSEYFEKAIEAISTGTSTEVETQIRHLVVNLRHLESPERAIAATVRKYLGLLTATSTNLEDQTMMTHYLKHLAQSALRHSFVKTVVSVTQLLFRFPTGEARDVYDHLEPGLGKSYEAKDLQFFAKARRELLILMTSRFGRLLRHEPQQAHNGATTYQIAASSATPEQTDFVKECLREFAPFDVRRSSKTPHNFSNKGEFVYQLLYPEQFDVLLAETGLAMSPRPIYWPVFTNTSGNGDHSSHDPQPPLRERELQAALAFLSQAIKRRRRWHGGMLRIVVDGQDFSFLNLDQHHECQLKVQAGASSIEVLARLKEGDLLLGQCMLSEEDFDPAASSTTYSVPLSNKQKISFTITPQTDEEGLVTIAYQESWLDRIIRKSSQTAISLFPTVASSPSSAYAIPWFNKWKLAMVVACSGVALFFGLVLMQAVMFSNKTTSENLPRPAVIAYTKSDHGQQQTTLGSDNGNESEYLLIQPKLKPSGKDLLCGNLSIEMNGGNTRLYNRVESQLTNNSQSTGLKFVKANEKAGATLKIKANWRYGPLGWFSNTAVIEVGLYPANKEDSDISAWPPATNGRLYTGSSENVLSQIVSDLSKECK